MELQVLVQGNLRPVEEFENLLLTRSPSVMVRDSGPDGSLIRLRDVGRAEYAFQNFNQAAINLITGHPWVGLVVIQPPGSNAIITAEAVDQVLMQFRSTLPPGVKLEKVFDQTDFINASIFGALDALRDAVVLVLELVRLIIFLFLQDWKATKLPVLALSIALLVVIYRQFALTIVFSILVSTFNAISGKQLQSAPPTATSSAGLGVAVVVRRSGGAGGHLPQADLLWV